MDKVDTTLMWLSVTVLLLAELKVATWIVKISFVLEKISYNV